MNIVQVMTDIRPAGTESVVLDLSRSLRGRGHPVAVVSLLSEPAVSPISSALRDAGIPVHSLNLDKRRSWRVARLGPLLRELSPDLVHSHLFHANVACRLVRGRTFALVNTVHTVEDRARKALEHVLDRWTRRRADALTAVSHAAAEFYAAKLGIGAGMVTVVPNGIAPPAPVDETASAALRREWGVESCAVVLGSVGRLVHYKGFDLLLDLAGQLAAERPETRLALVVIGDGPERSALLQRARTLPANLTVVFPGYRPDAASACGAFDLFVMPSRLEGFGLALVEAMSHGLPVLVNEVGSLPELVQGYPAARVRAFEAAPETELLEDVAALLDGGRTTPRQPVSVDAMTDGYLQVYRSALTRRNP